MLKHFKLILLWGILLALVSVGLSLFWPRSYRAESEALLIIPQAGLDPYLQGKSAERLGETLAQVLGTMDFWSQVMARGGATFDQTRWQGLSPRALRRRWRREVTGAMLYNSSLLRLRVYGPTPEEAVALSAAVTETMAARGSDYLGAAVTIKVVNAPLVSRWPARPNLALNALVGLLVGGLLAALWVVRYRHPKIFG